MSINAVKIASDFNEKFLKIKEEREKAREEFLEEFKRLYEKVRPIVEVMKKNNVYFTHPLMPNALTTRGVIVGRDLRNPAHIFVFNGDNIVRGVDSNDNFDDEVVRLDDFLIIADSELAFLGVSSLLSRLDDVISNEKETIGLIKSFSQKMRDASDSNTDR